MPSPTHTHTHTTLSLSVCVSVCVWPTKHALATMRGGATQRNSHRVMKHVAKDSSARAGNWIDTFGSEWRQRQRHQQLRTWWRVDEAAPCWWLLLGGCATKSPSHPSPAQPSQPMIALVSDELGMPQNWCSRAPPVPDSIRVPVPVPVPISASFNFG